MISSVLGYTTSEYVDEIILAFMSIFPPGQPPAILYDYAKFIENKMHDKFLRMNNERVFKYSLVLCHHYYIIKLINSNLLFKNLILEATLGQ